MGGRNPPHPSVARCYGRDYDNQDYECRDCGFNETCREEVHRDMYNRGTFAPYQLSGPNPGPQDPSKTVHLNVIRSPPAAAYPPPPPPYYPPPVQQQPQYAQPTPVWAPPPPPPQYRNPNPYSAPPQQWVQPQWNGPQQQNWQIQQTGYWNPAPPPWDVQQYGQLGVFGAYQDPMFPIVAGAVPPFRPQMQGESFVAALGKQTGLAVLQSLLGSMFLGVRQLSLAPPPPQQPPVPQFPPPFPPPVPGR